MLYSLSVSRLHFHIHVNYCFKRMIVILLNHIVILAYLLFYICYIAGPCLDEGPWVCKADPECNKRYII